MLVKKKPTGKISDGQLNSVNFESRLMSINLNRIKLVSVNDVDNSFSK